MANMTIKAELRNKVGKGSSRFARKNEKIPAIIYGDKKDPISINIKDYDFFMLNEKNDNILTRICDVEVEGKKESTLIRDIQYHPVTDRPLHIDFLRVNTNTELTIMVPLRFTNEELSPGLKKGGVLNIVTHEIELSCKANNIPEFIEIDLEGKEVGDSVHFADITLPEGVKSSHEDDRFTLAAITAPSALKSKEGSESSEEETAEGEEAAEVTEETTEEK